MKRISNTKELVSKECARQRDFGYEPSFNDMVIVGSEAQLKADIKATENMVEITPDFAKQLLTYDICLYMPNKELDDYQIEFKGKLKTIAGRNEN